MSVWKTDMARSSGLIFLASLIGNLTVFLADVIISNVLGPAEFGVFRTVFYLFTFLPVLIGFGIEVSITKYIAEFSKRSKEKIGYLVRWFLKIKLVSFSVLLLVIFILREQIAEAFLGNASMSYLVLPGILLAGMSFFPFFQSIVLGFQKFKLYALTQFLSLASSALLGVLLSGFGVFYIILGWSFGYLIGNLFNIKFFLNENIIKDGKDFDVKNIFMKFSLPMYFIGILVVLFNVVVPVLSLFFSQELIGYFSFAMLFYSATLLIPAAISSVVFPKVSELKGLNKHGDAKAILRKVLLLYGIIVAIGLVAVFLLSDWLFTFFPSYLPSLLMFKVLVGLGLLSGFNMIYTNYLQGLGRVKRFAVFVLAQNIILFAVSFALLS